MQRRNFIKISTIGAAVGLIIPKTVLATPSDKKKADLSGMLGNIIFNGDNQGRWQGKADSHLPMINRNGNTIKVETKHSMDSYTHYIVKHILLDENFQFIDETMFLPKEDKAVSEYNIKKLKHRIHVVSVCNIHDSWLNSISI